MSESAENPPVVTTVVIRNVIQVSEALELLVPVDLNGWSLHEANAHVVFLLIELYVRNVHIRANVGGELDYHFVVFLHIIHIDFALAAAH